MTEVDAEVIGPEEKDFVLFLDKEGRFNGDYDAPDGSPTSSASSRDDTAVANSTAANEQGAINEETGEINWDCPCLQAALAPPCGEFFREAFACFVASKTEPKGADCLEKFTAMQDCFRAHPEVYLKDDADDEGAQEDVTSLGNDQATAGTNATAAVKEAPESSSLTTVGDS